MFIKIVIFLKILKDETLKRKLNFNLFNKLLLFTFFNFLSSLLSYYYKFSKSNEGGSLTIIQSFRKYFLLLLILIKLLLIHLHLNL